MKKIKVVSKTNILVGLVVPELRIERLFRKEGDTFLISADLLEEAFYYPGVREVFEEGLLVIEDADFKAEVGLDDSDIVVLNESQIKAALVTKTAKELKEQMENLPKVQQERFADCAIKNQLTDYAKCKIIKELTGRDVIKTIELTDEEQ